MDTILRYDRHSPALTALDPLTDVISWIGGLRSQGYVSDILRTIHGFTVLADIESSAKSISTHADNSLGLIQQGFAGSPEISFLPLYYSILNLSMIYVIVAGNGAKLQKERHHGANYPIRPLTDLMGEQIVVTGKGSLSLLYEALTRKKITATKITLGEVYPYISPIAYEYAFASGQSSGLQTLYVKLIGDPKNGFVLRCDLSPSTHSHANDLSFLQALEGFAQSHPQRSNVLTTPRVVAQTRDIAMEQLKKHLKRYLFYYPIYHPLISELRCETPLSDRSLLLPEELPIWLAFFHLSNVVRYRPERLSELRDSKYWAMLLVLERHGLFRFLLLFWSYLHQTTFTMSRV